MIETDILRDILLEEERVPSTNELAKIYTINPAIALKNSFVNLFFLFQDKITKDACKEDARVLSVNAVPLSEK